MKEVNKMQRFETQLYQMNLKQRDTATQNFKYYLNYIGTNVFGYISSRRFIYLTKLKTVLEKSNKHVNFLKQTFERSNTWCVYSLIIVID